MLREELAGDQDQLQQLQQELPQLEAGRKEVQGELQRIERELAAGQAAVRRWSRCRRAAGGKLPEWLRRHNLENAPPLWQKSTSTAAGEDAVEAVLRERLGAIACDDPAKLDEWLLDRPEARLSVVLAGTVATTKTEAGLKGPTGEIGTKNPDCLRAQRRPGDSRSAR